MVAYKVVWSVVCVGLALVGVGVTVIVSPAAVAFLFSTFAVVGAIATRLVVPGYEARPRRRRTTASVVGALVGGCAATGFVGLGLALGAGVFLLGVFVLLGSPAVVRAYTRWLATPGLPSAGRLDRLTRAFALTVPEYLPMPREPELHELTDDELCRAWRSSCAALEENPSGQELLRAVEQRQALLDELERRDGAGLVTWLGSDAGAAVDPLPYLLLGPDEARGIDWDELTRGQEL